MTTTTLTLAEFILQRITEDEAAARAATAGPWLVDSTAEDFPVLAPDASNYTWDGVFICTTRLDERGEANREDAEHIARHDPARVLADCEAKRQIVEQLERHERLVKANAEELAKASSSQPLDQERITALRTHGWELSGRLEALRMAADSLAAIWSDHPDYRPVWRS